MTWRRPPHVAPVLGARPGPGPPGQWRPPRSEPPPVIVAYRRTAGLPTPPTRRSGRSSRNSAASRSCECRRQGSVRAGPGSAGTTREGRAPPRTGTREPMAARAGAQASSRAVRTALPKRRMRRSGMRIRARFLRGSRWLRGSNGRCRRSYTPMTLPEAADRASEGPIRERLVRGGNEVERNGANRTDSILIPPFRGHTVGLRARRTIGIPDRTYLNLLLPDTTLDARAVGRLGRVLDAPFELPHSGTRGSRL